MLIGSERAVEARRDDDIGQSPAFLQPATKRAQSLTATPD